MGLSHYLDKLEETGMNLLVFSGEEVVYSSDKKGITPLMNL